MRSRRKAAKSVECTDLIRCKCPNLYLSMPHMCAKLKQLARSRLALDREVISLKKKLALYEKKAETMAC